MAKITVNEACIGDDVDSAKEAAESCPVEAIEVED